MDYEKPSVKKLNIKFSHITGTAEATAVTDSGMVVPPSSALT